MNAVRIKVQAGRGGVGRSRAGQGRAGQSRAGVDPLAPGMSKNFILFSALWFEEFLPFGNEKGAFLGHCWKMAETQLEGR